MNIVKSQHTGTSGESSNLVVGIGKFSIVAVNPTLKELSEVLNTDKITDEPVYIGETKENDTRVTISFWVENGQVGKKRHSLNLVDKVKVWEKSQKKVFINQHASTSTVAKEEDLPESFTTLQVWSKDDKKFIQAKDDNGKAIKLTYREALEGEPELMNLVKNWINGNYSDPDCNILLDTKKIFRGKFDELKSLVGSESVQDVVLALYVARVEREGEVKYYQNISKDSVNVYMWPKINICLQNGSWDSSKDTKKVKEKWTGDAYSITSSGANAFTLSALQPYKEEMFLNHTDKTLQKHDDEVTDTDY